MNTHFKKRKYIAIIFLYITCLMLSGKILAQELSITAQEKYNISDSDIYIKVTITNNSDDALIMPLLFICEDYYLRFEIENELGIKSEFIGKEINWIKSEMDVLRMFPKSSYTQVINIKDYYNIEKRGLYKIKAIYEITEGRRKEKGVWHGSLVSPKIEIEIK